MHMHKHIVIRNIVSESLRHERSVMINYSYYAYMLIHFNVIFHLYMPNADSLNLHGLANIVIVDSQNLHGLANIVILEIVIADVVFLANEGKSLDVEAGFRVAVLAPVNFVCVCVF